MSGAHANPAYAFGDNQRAGARLHLLADTFAPTMEAALARLPQRAWPRVLDLGCGPGSSTAHLRRLLPRADEIVGLDASSAFVEMAEKKETGARFELVDVTAPLPDPPADLIYARFLLTHLPNPLMLVTQWGRYLRADGWLVVEEPEAINAEGVFARYLDIAESLLLSSGGNAYTGALFDELNTKSLPDGLVVSYNESIEHRPDQQRVATIFRLNLATWRHHEFIVTNYPPSQLDELDHDLAALESGAPRQGPTWLMRQLMIRRVEGQAGGASR